MRDWRGPTGFVLGLCIGVGWLAAMIGITFQESPVTPQGAALLNTVGGAIIGGVVVWLGGVDRRTNGNGVSSDARSSTTRGKTMTESTLPDQPREPRDPATDPDRDIEATPQDVPDADDGDTPAR